MCCKNESTKIVVKYDAILNAREQFGLNTQADLLEFIGNNGLQGLVFLNSEPWRLNPKKDTEVLVDAYTFYSNRKNGYIAFMKASQNNFRYVIKSFHMVQEKLTLSDIGSNIGRILW
jgi:hypothetical protein